MAAESSTTEFLAFLNKSRSNFLAVGALKELAKKPNLIISRLDTAKQLLVANGFTQLNEANKDWKLEKGGKYFFTRTHLLPPRILSIPNWSCQAIKLLL